MLEHQKKVLQGVSNDPFLFRKELIKSAAWLNSHELTQLRLWVREQFYPVHKNIIDDILYPRYDFAS